MAGTFKRRGGRKNFPAFPLFRRSWLKVSRCCWMDPGVGNHQGPGSGHCQWDCVWWSQSGTSRDALRVTWRRCAHGPAVTARWASQIHPHQIPRYGQL